MTKKKTKKKNKYLSISQTVFSKKEITPKILDKFIEEYLDLMDKFGFESCGGFSISEKDLMNEEDL